MAAEDNELPELRPLSYDDIVPARLIYNDITLPDVCVILNGRRRTGKATLMRVILEQMRTHGFGVKEKIL